MSAALGRTLDDRVRSSLEAARENGHDFADWTNEQVTWDLMDCDADLEGRNPNHVLAAVGRVRGAQR